VLIRIDTREQHPLDFIRCPAVRGTISTFDYAIDGDHDFFAIERKSLSDLIQSLAIQGKGVSVHNGTFILTKPSLTGLDLFFFKSYCFWIFRTTAKVQAGSVETFS